MRALDTAPAAFSVLPVVAERRDLFRKLESAHGTYRGLFSGFRTGRFLRHRRFPVCMLRASFDPDDIFPAFFAKFLAFHNVRFLLVLIEDTAGNLNLSIGIILLTLRYL